jgi:hypothetical protein
MAKVHSYKTINSSFINISETKLVFDKRAKKFAPEDKRISGYISGKFLKGPIPLDWLSVAAGISQVAFKVGVALWYLKGLQGSEEVRFTKDARKQFRISRYSVYRALDDLQDAGLISAIRHKGRLPRVILLQQKGKRYG